MINYIICNKIKILIDKYKNLDINKLFEEFKYYKNKIKKNQYVCKVCNKKFTNITNMKNHIINKICEKQKEFRCTNCYKLFPLKKNLIYHMQNKVCQKNIYNFCEQKNIINNNEINNKINNEINNEIIDNEINNEIIDNVQLNKFKKKSIPLPLKKLVWNKYIGEEIGKAKCICCKLTDITQLSFSCGHIIPESKGGKLILDNLKPICQSCNSSMGTNNMNDYIQYFEF